MMKKYLIAVAFLMSATMISADVPAKPTARITCDVPRFVLNHALDLWAEEIPKVEIAKGFTLEAKSCDLREISCTPEKENQIILVDEICSVLHYNKAKPSHMKPTGEKKAITVKIRMTPDGILSRIK